MRTYLPFVLPCVMMTGRRRTRQPSSLRNFIGDLARAIWLFNQVVRYLRAIKPRISRRHTLRAEPAAMSQAPPRPPPGSQPSPLAPKAGVEIPKDQSATQMAAAPVATLSSAVDPWPHYTMSAACE